MSDKTTLIAEALAANSTRRNGKRLLANPDQALKACYQASPEDFRAVLQSPLLANPAFLAAAEQQRQTSQQANHQLQSGCNLCSAEVTNQYQIQTPLALAWQAFVQAAAAYFRRLKCWLIEGLKK